MTTEIIIPRLGWSMEEGAFVAWLKNDGDRVQSGEPLFSIEGDKAVQEIESIDSGVLKIAPGGPKAGDPIRVGQVLGHLIPFGEKVDFEGVQHNPPAQRPAAVSEPDTASVSQQQPPPSKDKGLTVANPVESWTAISPRARRVAEELGVEWRRLKGSGRSGRIRERDVRAASPRAVSGSVVPIREHPGQVVFFGELLLSLTVPAHERFVQARSFEVRYTGAEANAAVSLANFGMDAFVVSAVPDNEIGQSCINFLRQHGIRTEHVQRLGDRLGVLYLENGAPPRPSKVIYDRAGSGFSGLGRGQFDWDKIFEGKDWFHWSGTAPALGPGIAGLILEASEAARRNGLKVSCDLNYRSKLWTPERAGLILGPLLEGLDLFVGSEEQLELIFGISAGPRTSDRTWKSDCDSVAESMRRKFKIAQIALTARHSAANATEWQAFLSRGVESNVSRSFQVEQTGRIGSGDAFSGALIYALLAGMNLQNSVDFAAAAGCLKHSIPGDFNLVTVSEVQALLRGSDSIRVDR